MATHKHNQRRRGVILLVLLGMLALFGATAFAFVVIASHGNRAAKSYQRVDRVVFSPRQDLDDSMRQVLRGTKNPHSVLRTHSLFEDIYGSAQIGGWVVNRWMVAPIHAPSSGAENDRGVKSYLLPGTATATNSYQRTFAPVDTATASQDGNGQILEFTAGYTIPGPPDRAPGGGSLVRAIGGPIGGLDVSTGNPVGGGLTTPTTVTIPPHFGYMGNNFDSAGNPQNNEPFEFRRRIGCVLTILDPDSVLYNKSTRIVGYRRVEVRDDQTDPNSLKLVYHRYQVLPFEGVASTVARDYFAETRYSSGASFVINGVPFAGKGAGYRAPRPPLYSPPDISSGSPDPGSDPTNTDPLNGTSSAAYDSAGRYPYALLPNPTDPAYHNNLIDDTTHEWAAGKYAPLYLPVNSPNEDYDAPDYQNMFLALERYNGADDTIYTRSPSLHRPALAHFWVNQIFTHLMSDYASDGLQAEEAWKIVVQPFGTDALINTPDWNAIVPLDYGAGRIDRRKIAAVKRRCLMRPIPEDHINFSGSNSQWKTHVDRDLSGLGASDIPLLMRYAREAWGAFDPGNTTDEGQWDVDTDGDGVADSIWVDLGLPVRTLPDGRKIKPMVAMRCVDHDGKVNLNTAGTAEHLYAAFTNTNVAIEGFWPDGTGLSELEFGIAYADELNVDPTDNGYNRNDDDYPRLPAKDFARGQGCGVAEINPIYGSNPILSTTIFEKLLLGYKGMDGADYVEYEGRYGELEKKLAGEYYRPAPGATSVDTRIFDATSLIAQEAINVPELLTIYRMFGFREASPRGFLANTGFPNNYQQSLRDVLPYQRNNTAYGTPLDLKGVLAIGLDFFGQPIYSTYRIVPRVVNANGYLEGVNRPLDAPPGAAYDARFNPWHRNRFDTPYELRLKKVSAQSVGTGGGLDNPFTIAEYEPLLRPYDTDILRLPDRLRKLLGASANSRYRLQTTTESWDLPVPNLAIPKDLQAEWNNSYGGKKTPLHFIDLLKAKLIELQEGWNDGTPTDIWYELPGSVAYLDPDRVRLDLLLEIADDDGNNPTPQPLETLLAPELMAGLRMDLNRPFGNGIDDDGDGVVDEPSEITNEPSYFLDPFNLSQDSVAFNHNNDNGTSTIAIRQHYARHLYVLMMALVDQKWYPYWDPEILNAGTITGPLRQRARARVIAQWAVNVVDYRDRDSIMTRFDYDVYPFAHDTSTTGIDPITGLVPGGEQYNTWHPSSIVWGCERPELLITETLAFHDRRTENLSVDNTWDPGNTPSDDDFDQFYRPMGSLFVELYNPNSASEAPPGEFHYDHTQSPAVWEDGVRLNQVTPGAAATRYPVWRMAIVTRAAPGSNYTYLDPDDPTANLYPDRLVYFVEPSLVAGHPNNDGYQAIFHPSGNTPDTESDTFAPILPHRYAVIGPGMDNGSGGAITTTQIGDTSGAGSARRVVLEPDSSPQVQIFGDATNDDVDNELPNIHEPTAIVIDAPRRLSVSEPWNGYEALATAAGSTYDATTQTYNPVLDTPLDKQLGAGADDDTLLAANPNWQNVLGYDGTHTGYRYIHLQRLADPTRAWNATTNPYRTIDVSAVDLNVLNGRDRSYTVHQAMEPHVDATAVSFATVGGSIPALVSRQRGENAGTPAQLWLGHAPTGVPTTNLMPATPAAQCVATEPLAHSLGWANEWYGDDTLNPDQVSGGGFDVPRDSRGAPGTLHTTSATHSSANANNHIFTPNVAPWITWLNRPFANPLELLQVPAVSSSRLMFAYENRTFGSSYRQYIAGREDFGHLLSFFSAVDAPSSGGGATSEVTAGGKMSAYFPGVGETGNGLLSINIQDVFAPHLYRLLEYVRIPSRFVDSQGNPEELDSVNEPHLFHPPFNHISEYREPGKINLNTLVGYTNAGGTNISGVWQAIQSDHQQQRLGTYPTLIQSRRGYTNVVAGADQYGLENTTYPTVPLPTRFANPFRSFAGADLFPNVTAGVDTFQDIVQQGVNATLLRAFQGQTLDDSGTTPYPLFTPFDSSGQYAADNTQKNPFFEYQSLQRLSSLATTHSNVYSLWVTVGYFEVEKYDLFNPTHATLGPLHRQVYPDGYTLGQELGVDSGDVTRRRALYVIDRSIPVGFVPGEDLNTDKAVILRRFIE
jgi:hypothetical protein